MSFNDFWEEVSNSEVIFPLFLLLFSIVIGIALIMRKKANNDIYGDNDDSPISEERGAVFVTRSTFSHPYDKSVMIKKVVFELHYGQRIEFAIRDSFMFDGMVEGDRGTLRYQGKKFIGFEKD